MIASCARLLANQDVRRRPTGCSDRDAGGVRHPTAAWTAPPPGSTMRH